MIFFIESVPEFKVKDGLVYIEAGDGLPCTATRLTTFRRAVARAARVLREYDGKRAEVIELCPKTKSRKR